MLADLFHTVTCPTCRKYLDKKTRRQRQPIYITNRIRLQAKENQIKTLQKIARKKNWIHNFQETLAFIMLMLGIVMIMALVLLFSL